MATATETSPATKTRVYTLWTYDLWGNRHDGWNVNNRYKGSEVTVRCKRQTFNPGTNYEFSDYAPTNRQLNRAVGGRGLEWFGESDYTLYANTKSGKPVCELEFMAGG